MELSFSRAVWMEPFSFGTSKSGTHKILKEYPDEVCAVSVSPKGDLAAFAALNTLVLFDLKSGEMSCAKARQHRVSL